jgi:hypothetical protein
MNIIIIIIYSIIYSIRGEGITSGSWWRVLVAIWAVIYGVICTVVSGIIYIIMREGITMGSWRLFQGSI